MTSGSETFYDLARRYCELLEQHTGEAPEALVRELLVLLPRLYASAWELPQFEPTSEVALEPSDELAGEERHIAGKLQTLFGDRDLYSLFYDPHEHGEAPVMSTIGGDLAEIYTDLRQVIRLYEQGHPDAQNGAVWEARFGLTTHWGRHVIEALKALHWIATDRGLPLSEA